MNEDGGDRAKDHDEFAAGGGRVSAAPKEERHLPIIGGSPHLPLAPAARPVDREHRPRVAVWELTLRCNLSCIHCGSRAGKARHDELSTEECLRVVDELYGLSVLEVSLIGGEAHLHPGFLQILRALKAHGIQVGMTTGGRGIGRELARSASEAGLDSVSVSLDGLAATHDTLRGMSGAFEGALGAIAAFQEASVFVAVNTQIGRANLEELEALLERVIEAGVRAWQVALTVAMGRAADHPELLLQPYDLVGLFPRLAAMKRRCDEANVRLWPGNNIGYFGPYEHVLRGQMPLGHCYSCGAGLSTLGIEADGNVKGCPSLPTDAWVGGNLREHSLKDIWECAAPLRYIRDRGLDDLWGFCRTCYYADECRGGCTWTAFSLFSRAGNNPYCHHRVLELARSGQRERLERVAPPPGTPFDIGKFRLVVEPIPPVTSIDPFVERSP
jgi:radical SAM protein with 4Fe4S-binding SPASM domain